ncbi:MAG: hypothetical protein IT285_06275 [Bdellovibrionales bacterium]|nr:hypothetical protein [Bdellovibrionales bacterium]
MADAHSYRDLFSRKTIVAVEPDGAVRPKLRVLLEEAGFLPERITLAEGYRVGLKALALKKPQAALFSYPALGAEAAAALAEFRRTEGSHLCCVFYVADAEVKHAKSAAARDSADGVFFRPLTFATLAKELGEALARVDRPSIFEKTLRSARAAIWAGAGAEIALHELMKARQVATTEAHAHADLGEMHALKGDRVEASKAFTEGLRIDSSDYRCLVGLSRVLMELGKPLDAYRFHEKCLRNYPLLPERVNELLRLAIATKRFDDLVSYHALLKRWSVEDAKTWKALAGALTLAGRALVIQNQAPEALKMFQLGWESASRDSAIRVSLACAMLKCGLAREAKRLYAQDSAVAEDPAVLLGEFDDLYRSSEPRPCVLFGLELLKRGIKSPALYLGVIERSVAMGRRKGVVEEIINQAIRAFPDHRSQFDDYRVLLQDD